MTPRQHNDDPHDGGSLDGFARRRPQRAHFHGFSFFPQPPPSQLAVWLSGLCQKHDRSGNKNFAYSPRQKKLLRKSHCKQFCPPQFTEQSEVGAAQGSTRRRFQSSLGRSPREGAHRGDLNPQANHQSYSTRQRPLPACHWQPLLSRAAAFLFVMPGRGKLGSLSMRRISPLSSCLPNLIGDRFALRKFAHVDHTDSSLDVKPVTPVSEEQGENRAAAETAPRHRNDKSVVTDRQNWFAAACDRLYGPADDKGRRNKAGTALWALTGWDERSCQRYAAGTVKPPAAFLAALLRSSQGWAWLCSAMEGTDAPWWGDLKRASRIYAAIKDL